MARVSRNEGLARQIGAATLVLAMSALPGLAVAGETGARSAHAMAEIRGTILGADGLKAVEGAIVKAANMKTRAVYTSAATKADGGYSLSGLPAGSYDLAVEMPQGLFVSDALVQAQAGKKTLVSMALRAAASQEEGEESQAEEGEKAEGEEGEQPAEPEPEPEQEKKKKKGAGFWRSPWGAAIIIVAGAGLVGAAASSATDDAIDVGIPKMTPGGG